MFITRYQTEINLLVLWQPARSKWRQFSKMITVFLVHFSKKG